MATNSSQNIITAATGKVLQGAGVGTASTYSTATYPSTATGTGKILRADGTNFVASTATYPDTAGTSANILTSDGTNWISSAPSGSSNFSQSIAVGTGNPADSTTYYFSAASIFTAFTTVSGPTKFVTTTACTITKVYGTFSVGVTGSAENCTLFLRKNDTTNTNIATNIQLTSASVSVTNTGLSISLSAGDYVTWGFTGPAWATNPTGVAFFGAFTS